MFPKNENSGIVELPWSTKRRIGWTDCRVTRCRRISDADLETLAAIIEVVNISTDIAVASRTLTVRQKRFCHEYLLDSNGSRAAVRDGYSPRTAKQQGSFLLTKVDVRALIDELTIARTERIDFDSDRVLLELKHIATSTMADFIDDQGRLITDLSKVRPEAAAAVECCEESIRADGSVVRKIKLYNRVPALEKVGRHVKVWAFEDRANGPTDVNITVVSGIDGTPGSSC